MSGILIFEISNTKWKKQIQRTKRVNHIFKNFEFITLARESLRVTKYKKALAPKLNNIMYLIGTSPQNPPSKPSPFLLPAHRQPHPKLSYKGIM